MSNDVIIDEQLSISHTWDRRILYLYAHGKPKTHIAKKIGRGVAYVNSVIRRPDFIQELNVIRESMDEKIVLDVSEQIQMSDLKKAALEALADGLGDDNPAIRITAAKVTLDESRKDIADKSNDKVLSLDDVRTMSVEDARRAIKLLSGGGQK